MIFAPVLIRDLTPTTVHFPLFPQQADFVATPRYCVGIMQVLHAAGDWKGINEHIVLLSKRRAQVKAAVSDMVKEAMLYVEAQQDKDKKIKLIETLNDVTEGKIYVEIERARLVRQLVRIREGQGKIKEAAEILQSGHIKGGWERSAPTSCGIPLAVCPINSEREERGR